MKVNWMTVAKVAVGVVSVGVTVADKFFTKKDQEAEIAKKVAEALTKKMEES